MSVGREEGNDTNSPSPSRTSECVSGPSVPEGSNPQDRMEPEPDRSRQEFSCLGQTVRGSVRPREKHEIGNVRLPRRDRPDSARLAQSGVVPGPIRSRDRLSNNSPTSTSAETAQADLLTPLSSASVESQPSRLEVIRDSTRREDFLKRLPKGSLYLRDNPQRGFYESKWKVFGEWCHVKQMNPVKATVQQLADFLIFLFEEKKLAISSLQGYKSCISKVFLARGSDISHDRDLNMLVRISPSSALCNKNRVAPRWDFMIVMRPPFEPMNMASLADMTRKLAFLLTLASAERNSEVWAFSADVRFGQDRSQ